MVGIYLLFGKRAARGAGMKRFQGNSRETGRVTLGNPMTRGGRVDAQQQRTGCSGLQFHYPLQRTHLLTPSLPCKATESIFFSKRRLCCLSTKLIRSERGTSAVATKHDSRTTQLSYWCSGGWPPRNLKHHESEVPGRNRALRAHTHLPHSP